MSFGPGSDLQSRARRLDHDVLDSTAVRELTAGALHTQRYLKDVARTIIHLGSLYVRIFYVYLILY